MPSSPSRLKILVLLNRVPYPLNDGGAIGAYNFVKGYAEAGCEVTMLAMNTAKHYVEEPLAQAALGAFGKLHLVPVDNRIKPLHAFWNLWKGSSYIIDRFVSDEYGRQLRQLLNAGHFDVVHVDGLPPAAYLNTVRSCSKALIAMRAHNVEHVIWQRIGENEPRLLKRWYVLLQAKRLRAFEEQAFAHCDLILAISKEDQETIQRCCQTANTTIVPAGMDIPDEVANANYNPLDLCFIGSFDWMPNQQGINWFLEAIWPTLLAAFPGIQLHLAGKKMPAALFGISEKSIHAHGEVPDAQAFMLSHGLLIVPVISGSGIRIKILEAMALGKAVLATPIAVEGLGLTDAETVLIANDAEAFKSQLTRCLSEASLAPTIGEKAHKFAYEKYRNRSLFDKLLNEYRAML